jgi:hypothetical protein
MSGKKAFWIAFALEITQLKAKWVGDAQILWDGDRVSWVGDSQIVTVQAAVNRVGGEMP